MKSEERIQKIEYLLHSCLDLYIPPIIKDTSQSFRIIAETVENFYSTEAYSVQMKGGESDK